jgi:hypothetical protein
MISTSANKVRKQKIQRMKKVIERRQADIAKRQGRGSAASVAATNAQILMMRPDADTAGGLMSQDDDVANAVAQLEQEEDEEIVEELRDAMTAMAEERREADAVARAASRRKHDEIERQQNQSDAALKGDPRFRKWVLRRKMHMYASDEVLKEEMKKSLEQGGGGLSEAECLEFFTAVWAAEDGLLGGGMVAASGGEGMMEGVASASPHSLPFYRHTLRRRAGLWTLLQPFVLHRGQLLGKAPQEYLLQNPSDANRLCHYLCAPSQQNRLRCIRGLR